MPHTIHRPTGNKSDRRHGARTATGLHPPRHRTAATHRTKDAASRTSHGLPLSDRGTPRNLKEIQIHTIQGSGFFIGLLFMIRFPAPPPYGQKCVGMLI